MSSSEFDVFLCHNSEDKPAVRHIGDQLKAQGLRPWLDEWELQPGLPWQAELEKQITNVKAAAVFVGDAGIGPWQDMEQRAFLNQFVKRKCPVIPVILPKCKATPELPPFLEGMVWVDFRRADLDPLQQLIWGITGERPYDRPTGEKKLVELEKRRQRLLNEWDDSSVDYVANAHRDGLLDSIEQFIPLPVERERFAGKPSAVSAGLQAVSIEEAMEESPRLVLLGGPGAGKTSFLRHQFVECLKTRERLPVYVELKEWGPKASLDELLCDALNRSRFAGTRPSSESKMRSDVLHHAIQTPEARFLFLFDGLDEIRDSTLRIGYVRMLITFLGQCSCDWQCILSSRKNSFDADVKNPLTQAEFQVFETVKLGEAEKLAVIKKYAPPNLADEILDAIKQNYRLARLTDNVLLLSLFAKGYSPGGKYPNTRARILEADVRSRINKISGAPGRTDETQDGLAALAHQMRDQGRSDLFVKDDALPLLVDRIPSSNLETARELLDQLVDDSRILSRGDRLARETVYFALPQYEEYFLARSEAKPLDDALRGQSPCNEIARLRVISEYREWYAVLVLAAGLLDEPQVETLAECLGTNEYLFLKAEILAEAEAPRAEQAFRGELEDRMISDLKSLFRGGCQVDVKMERKTP